MAYNASFADEMHRENARAMDNSTRKAAANAPIDFFFAMRPAPKPVIVVKNGDLRRSKVATHFAHPF